MSSEPSRQGHDVRMNVKVSRRDFPVLTDEIASLPKGPRRTNRLAHLATLGLLWERAVVDGAGAPPMAVPPEAAPRLPEGEGYRSRLDPVHLLALLDDDSP